MNTTILIGALAGSMGAVFVMSQRSGKAKKLALGAVPLLAQRGPMNLQAIAAALGVTASTDINYLSIALNEMAARRELLASQPPPGTPLLERKNAIVYSSAG